MESKGSWTTLTESATRLREYVRMDTDSAESFSRGFSSSALHTHLQEFGRNVDAVHWLEDRLTWQVDLCSATVPKQQAAGHERRYPLKTNLGFSLESLNALKPLFPLLQKAISRILDHGYSILDSPKANKSFSKVDKLLTKEQEEDKVSKKGNKKAKQTSEKPPHCRSEGRSKQKSSSITGKKSKDVSPSTSLTLSSSNTAVITKTITRTLPLKQKMHFVNVKAQHLQNINRQSKSIKDLEIKLLQVECEELKNRLGCLREGLMGQKPGDMEKLLKQSQKEVLWLQRQLSFISTGGPVYVLAASKKDWKEHDIHYGL
ncbi:uncharacterized protein M6G45_012012 [Spheniscus humboldti]